MIRKSCLLIALFAVAFSLTGCLSHWFSESSTRLQVENDTEFCTLLRIDVMSEDSSSYETWIKETVKPGEKSHVVEKDWVGSFTLRFSYTRSADGSGKTVKALHRFDFDGGSDFLSVGFDDEGDSLTYRFK